MILQISLNISTFFIKYDDDLMRYITAYTGHISFRHSAFDTLVRHMSITEETPTHIQIALFNI